MSIAIVGGGYIVPEFWRAVDATPDLTVRGIWARRADVRTQLAAAHAVVAYDTFDQLLRDPAVDTIYLALSNHVHYEYAMHALAAGKHVLIEKPVVLRADEARTLFHEAARRGLVLFEMITNQYHPFCAEIARRLPDIGPIRIATFNYSQYSSRYDAFRRGEIHPVFDSAKGGGALPDLNIYNLHLAIRWLGVPAHAAYIANRTRGVDTSGTVLLQYPDMVCTCTAAKDCDGPSGFSLQGEHGCIFSDAAPNVLNTYSVQLRGHEAESFVLPRRASRMCDELDAFSAHLAVGDRAWFAERAAHSIQVMEVLETLLTKGSEI